MLALKLVLVPLSVLVVSMSGRWWGPGVAGWLAGLPVVAGPILFLLVLAHGPLFGAHAAILALAAILASEAFNFAYAWSCRSREWPVALACGLGVWFVAALGLASMPVSAAWAVAGALFAVAFGQTFLPRSSAVAKQAPLTAHDLIGRMIAGGSADRCRDGALLGGGAEVEWFAGGLPVARMRAFGFFTSRARMRIRDLASSRHGAGPLFLCGLLPLPGVCASKASDRVGVRRSCGSCDGRAVDHANAGVPGSRAR
jgi:hypothetical protein